MLRCVATSLLLSGTLLCPLASGQLSVAGLKRNFDTDKDGLIQKSEAKNQLQKNFDRLDANGDGTLDDAELTALVKRLNRANERPGRKVRLTVPDGVTLEQDVAYRRGDSKKWTVDVAVPDTEVTDQTPRRAAIVFIHGGGWRSGDKGSGQWRSLPLQYAEQGYVCLSVNYRLLDEAPLPACIEDCRNAVRWLRANADKYHIDPDRIGAYGNSAGAHLVSLLGLADDDAGLNGDGPHQEFSGRVNAVVCSAPPTNFLNWTGRDEADSRRLLRLFGDIEESQALELARRCSPVTYAGNDVPFLVVHGTADRTVPVYQGDSFVDALKKADADVTYIRVEGAGHGVFGQAARQTQPAMKRFFARTLAAGDDTRSPADGDSTKQTSEGQR